MCCPLFIIRLDAPNFKLSKSQKKVLKKLNNYLLTGETKVKSSTATKMDCSTAGTTDTGEVHKKESPSKGAGPDSSPKKGVESDTSKASMEGVGPDTSKPPMKEAEPDTSKPPMKGVGPDTAKPPMKGVGLDRLKPPMKGVGLDRLKPPMKGAGPDPSKPPCRKAKDVRRERRLLKQSRTGQTSLGKSTEEVSSKRSVESLPHVPKTLEELLQFPSLDKNPVHTLEIRLIQSHPQSQEFRQTLPDSYQVYKKYQINIHKDKPGDINMKQYTDFLVNSPLIPETGPSEWARIGFGSYHQQYYLDGRLIMVGVVDILRNCISSKYLYYDTEYEFLNMGVVSALNEIKLVRQLHQWHPSCRYYCMGYYNNTCQKMSYKGQYTPSSLLCTATNTYVPIEKCLPKLDIIKYTKLADDEEPDETVKNPIQSYVDSTVLAIGRPLQAIGYNEFKMATHTEVPAVSEYASLVGPVVAKRAFLLLKN